MSKDNSFKVREHWINPVTNHIHSRLVVDGVPCRVIYASYGWAYVKPFTLWEKLFWVLTGRVWKEGRGWKS